MSTAGGRDTVRKTFIHVHVEDAFLDVGICAWPGTITGGGHNILLSPVFVTAEHKDVFHSLTFA